MKEHQYKAAIFDLDGTLADTIHSIAYSANEALRELGYPPFEEQEFRYFAGDGVAMLVKRILYRLGDEQLVHYEELKDIYEKKLELHCMYRVNPFEGISETLQQLKSSGMQLAVLSNKPQNRVDEVIPAIFGADLFSCVVGQREGMERKPSPEGAFYVARQLKLMPNEIAYIGDTDTDMKTGKSAGMYTIGVLWGFRDRKELMENGADLVISQPRELINFI